MRSIAKDLLTLVTTLAVITGLLLVTPVFVSADQGGCGLGLYDLGSDECQISGAISATGTQNFHHSVHMLAGSSINASGGGIVLNINGAAGLDLIMDAGAVIEADDDNAPSGASASPITINVSGDATMAAGSKISAEDSNNGGDGANITIDVDGDMTMSGASGATPGAFISSRKTAGAGDTGVPGNIALTVGNPATASGDFFMGGGSTTYGAETGARIDATGTGPSGDISIHVGHNYFSQPGSVVASGGYNHSAIQQGGMIAVVAGCELTTQGRITSKGTDPGGDLVHLEGCDVLVQGLVESTGKGHTVSNDPTKTAPPLNSCDGNNDSLPGEVIHLDKLFNATGCIEVWGNNITIDSVNGSGELNADVGNGGPEGMSWIDIYAFSSLVVSDGAGNDRNSDNLGDHVYFSTYAVHANQLSGSDTTPGIVTAKVKSGTLTANAPDGNVFQASTIGNGSDGGSITAEASGAVNLDNSFLDAHGDLDDSPNVDGGQISVSSWASTLSWQNGDGDVRPDGEITLNACTPAINTTGTEFHLMTVTPSNTCDGAQPAIPGYVTFNFDQWALCVEHPRTGSVVVHKLDGETKDLVGGAVFSIAADPEGAPQAMTEELDGVFCIDGLSFGDYIVTEDSPPPDYSPADPASQPITVDSESTCQDQNRLDQPDLTFLNDKIKEATGSVVVHKLDGQTDELVGGAVFSIAADPAGSPQTMTEGPDGVFCIDGLSFGDYTVTEDSPPPDYSPADPASQPVTVDSESTCADEGRLDQPDATFWNDKIEEGKGSITIVKQVDCQECEARTRGYYFNNGGAHLDETNGLFAQTDAYGDGGIDADGQTFNTVAEVQDYLDADTSGESDGHNGLSNRGQLTAQYLAAVLNVRRAGEGCDLANRVYNDASSPFDGWTVGQILEEAQNAFGGTSSYTDVQIKDALDAINNSSEGEVNPLSCGEGSEGALLNGVTFDLFTKADFEPEPQGDPTDSGQTGDNGEGTLIFDGLQFGDYVLVESGVPEGLTCKVVDVKASEGADATLNEDGTISITLSDAGQGTAEISLTVVNVCSTDQTPETGSLLVAKVDAADPEVLLGGATFKINDIAYTDDDGDGFVCVDGLTLGDTASVEETNPPAGYIGEAGVQDVLVLNPDGCSARLEGEATAKDADLVVENEAQPPVVESVELALTKVNQAGAPIGSVAFNLTGTGYNQTKSTNSAGQVSFTGLLKGSTYTLTESEPTNCTSKDPWTVSVALDGTLTVTDKNAATVPVSAGRFTLVNTCTEGNVAAGGGTPGGGTVANTAYGRDSFPFGPLLALLVLALTGLVVNRNVVAVRRRR